MPARRPHSFQENNVVRSTRVYVPRPSDKEYLRLLQDGHDVHVLGSRQCGKSSLVAHAVPALEAAGFRVAYVDVAATSPHRGIEAGMWLRAFIRELYSAIDQRDEGIALLEREPAISLVETLRMIVSQSASPFLLILDEFDSLERFPSFARSVLEVLRAAEQERDRGDSELARLQLSIVGVKRPDRVFAGVGSGGAPKEVGGRFLWLDDFDWQDPGTIAALQKGFPRGTRNTHDFARHALEYSGGYPQFTTWLCVQIVERDIAYTPDLPRQLRELVEQAKLDHLKPFGVIDDYLGENDHSSLGALETYLQVLSGNRIAVDGRDGAHSLLRWSGLCRVDSAGRWLRPRCPLLEEYFDVKWARDRVAAIRQRRWGARPGPRRERLTKKKIAILVCGGTIGMLEQDDQTVTAPGDVGALPLDLVDQIAEYKAIPVFEWDSADVGPNEWRQVAEAIAREARNYDGFVVAHGTDTMAYTASAVAFALGPDLNFPVVFTGSQTTFDVEHGDARTNLLRACLVATQDLWEVVICFDQYMFRACRTEKKDDKRFDAFESPSWPPLGYVAEDVDLLEQNFRTRQRPRGPLTLRPNFSDGILVVTQTPGARAEFYESALGALDEIGRPLCRGVVIQSLGAGNVPSRDRRYSLVPLIKKATDDMNIPVILTSQYPVYPRNIYRYSPAGAAVAAGAKPVGTMTMPAAVAKLSWVLHQVNDQIAKGYLAEDQRILEVTDRMQRNEIGEIDEVKATPAPSPSENGAAARDGASGDLATELAAS